MSDHATYAGHLDYVAYLCAVLRTATALTDDGRTGLGQS